MFTGIVEEIGTVRAVEAVGGGAELTIGCPVVAADARVGESVSVNGCCVTVTGLAPGPERGFRAGLMGETLRRTALGRLRPGAAVNLERALRVGDRLGGHLVQGHVDAVGTVVDVEPREGWTLLTVSLPAALGGYVAEKGSLTVDGVSLTVVAVDDRPEAVDVRLGLIAHTLAVTVLGRRVPGDPVNIEVDVLAKYVERLLRGRADHDAPAQPR